MDMGDGEKNLRQTLDAKSAGLLDRKSRILHYADDVNSSVSERGYSAVIP